MKRGLVIGKFMPIHQGHIELINFATRNCDELIVSMSYTSSDAIDGHLRFSWIQDIFKNQPQIKTAIVKDDFDNESLPLHERTRIWADFIRRTFPSIDVIFSSEEYGASFAEHLKAENKVFDLPRTLYPVSATGIRQKSFQYWEFIPPIVRPYFVKKFCFYGPESTGKSTMAKRMAELFQTEFVPEVAREIITSNDFSVEDIIKIGEAQTERVIEKTKTANKILFCDTDLITTQLYSDQYLGVVPEILLELEKAVQYELYFLFDIDVPWIADGLRDLGSKRKEMFAIFKEALDRRKIKYILINGDWQQREDDISQVIHGYLK